MIIKWLQRNDTNGKFKRDHPFSVQLKLTMSLLQLQWQPREFPSNIIGIPSGVPGKHFLNTNQQKKIKVFFQQHEKMKLSEK